MAILIDKFHNHRIEFIYSDGQFDQWKVFHTNPKGRQVAPRDVDYFTFFKNLSQEYGAERIYNDFVHIFEVTDKNIYPIVLELIELLSSRYDKYSLDVRVNFVIMYGGMIAEENKAGAILGKRIKRLGMHQLLLDNFTPEEAADFSRGKKVAELNLIMKSKGF